jgi:hypothetical protein
MYPEGESHPHAPRRQSTKADRHTSIGIPFESIVEALALIWIVIRSGYAIIHAQQAAVAGRTHQRDKP